MKCASRAIPLVTALCLSLFSGTSPANEPGPPQEQVKIHFDWPAGLTAQISAAKSRSRTRDGGPPVTVATGMSYTMKTARKGEQLAVSYDGLAFDAETLNAMPEGQRRVTKVMMEAAMPSYLVSAQGDFAALENYEAFAVAMQRVFESVIPAGAARQQIQPMMNKLTSSAALTALAAGEWGWLVGAWTGSNQSFDLGHEYVAKSVNELPFPGMGSVEFQNHFTLKRKVPCERGGVLRECVVIIALNEPDAGGLAKSMEKFANAMAPAAAAKVRLDALQSKTTLELVTETATLLPHSYTLTKSLKLTATENDKQSVIESLEETRLEFTYPAEK